MKTSHLYYNLPPTILAVMTPVRLALGLLTPGVSVDMIRELRTRVAREGKFGKVSVIYTPVTPILPAAWFYDCADCTFYREQSRDCDIVKGNIEPYAWCGLWINRGEDLPFSWIERALT